VVSWQRSGMPAAAVRRRCFSAGFIWEHLDEASMPIQWLRGINERFDQRSKVQVSERQQNLAGRIGTVMKIGWDGNNQFYELQFEGTRGRKVVSAQVCSLIGVGGEVLSSGEGSRISHLTSLTSHISHLYRQRRGTGQQGTRAEW